MAVITITTAYQLTLTPAEARVLLSALQYVSVDEEKTPEHKREPAGDVLIALHEALSTAPGLSTDSDLAFEV